MLHHEEIYKSSQYNILNLSNLLVSNIEPIHDNSIFESATSKPDSMEFVKAIIKDISAREDENTCNLFIRRELNG